MRILNKSYLTKSTTKKQKHKIKRIFSYLLLGKLFLIILLVVGYFTPVINCNTTQEKCNYSICIINDGMHINIVIPVKNDLVNWEEFINISDLGKDAIANYKYLTFGWGDRDFYIQTPTLAEFNLITASKALFLPTPSTILVQGFSEIPRYQETKCVKVTQTDYLQLIQFIQKTFQLNSQNEPIRIANGHSSNSGFYAANGNYSIGKTCNNWVAEALKKANVDTPLWAGLSSAVMLHFKRTCECNLVDEKTLLRNYSGGIVK